MAKTAICGDGMCPYVPCKKYPNCNHVKKTIKEAVVRWR